MPKRGKSGKKAVKFNDLEKPVERDENEPSPLNIIRSPTHVESPRHPSPIQQIRSPIIDPQAKISLKNEIGKILRRLCWTDYFNQLDNIKEKVGEELKHSLYQYIITHPDTKFFGDVAVKACHINSSFTQAPITDMDRYVADFIDDFDKDFTKIKENLDHLFDQRDNATIWRVIDVQKEIVIRDLVAKNRLYDAYCRYEDDKLNRLYMGLKKFSS